MTANLQDIPWEAAAVNVLNVIFTFVGRGVVVNSLQLESKVYNGIPANQPVHNYVASLQVNCIHICSAGWFATQFFITTGRCSYYIKDRMENYLENATVVVGSNCMSEGQSFNILFLLHHPKFIHTMPKNSTDFDIGIIMVSYQLFVFIFLSNKSETI